MMIHPILEQVRRRIEKQGLSMPEAATEIGVTTQSLSRHLEAEYVRSDSLAKYRLWLERPVTPARDRPASKSAKGGPSPITPKVQLTLLNLGTPADTTGPVEPQDLWTRVHAPVRPHRVVDIFSGCGGLSLGFDRFEDGHLFQTVLALDLEEPMIRVFNDNHPSLGAELPRGREADVTDFLNEAEIQAFYLDHLSRSGQDATLDRELKDVAGFNLHALRANLQLLDRGFLATLNTLRQEEGFVKAYRKLGGNVLSQTSVIAFHRALKLPQTALGMPRLETLLWADDGKADTLEEATLEGDVPVFRTAQRKARRLWDDEVAKLQQKASGNGKGQLSSSAKRIQDFVSFITGDEITAIRSAWATWRARRDALRALVFENPGVQQGLQALYNQGREISVLLGGPPCQGFSRIGRGKIRSLREQSVHAHEDEDSGDSRNQLLDQYVLFVSALAPRAFLFENVRHFQALVRIGDRTFDAAEALAEAIRSVTDDRGLTYSVASQIVVASEHLVPQMRERYLMAGVRADVTQALNGAAGPQWCIQLPTYSAIPLEVALGGLPDPAAAREDSAKGDGLGEVQVSRAQALPGDPDSAARLLNWLCPGEEVTTDSHVARRPRPDDAAFFDLMGPGKRWMDYRCDETPTLKRLQTFLSTVNTALGRTPALAAKLGISAEEAGALEQLLDGSLSVRLLLESIPPLPGETGHHLLAPNYLKKKDGQHGDWLARMDPSRPSKTMVSHMAKDTYAYVHPTRPRTLSVREAARIQTFPDTYRFRSVGLVDAFRMIGNAVPPLLSSQFADRVAQILWAAEQPREHTRVVPITLRGAARVNVAV